MAKIHSPAGKVFWEIVPHGAREPLQEAHSGCTLGGVGGGVAAACGVGAAYAFDPLAMGGVAPTPD